MSDTAVAPPARQSELRRRYAAIEARLDGGAASDDAVRAQLKAEIIALYRTVDQQLTELSGAQGGNPPPGGQVEGGPTGQVATNAPQFNGEPPVVHADHIGASTFIEKGWSRISLGDYEGAEAALEESAGALAQRPAVRVAAWVGADAAREVRRRAPELSARADASAGERTGAYQRRLYLPQEAHLR